ncbi:NAD(P)-dependent oxidoreductase [archaeon]|nr:MAG: NAD(P)-dependent oxidoreductase [archaeon]
MQSGYKVVVLARDPAKMLIPEGSGGDKANQLLVNPNLKIVQGDVTKQASVDAVFDAADDISGVIVTLGGKTKDVGPTMLTDGSRCIINAMKRKNQAKRIAVMTSIGTGNSERQAPLFFKALMYTVMKNIFVDKNNQEKLFTEPNGPGHDLEYCIVRPGGLGKGPATGVINVIDGQAGSIQRADVASFCLGAVCDDNFPYLRKTPCISSIGGTGWKKEPEKGFDNVKTLD